MVGCLVLSGVAAASTHSAPSIGTPSVGSRPAEAPADPDYSSSSDYELTRIGARWDDLSVPERRALLKEVKLRMAQRTDQDGVLVIRTQRRYGRILHSGDGRYLKIETKVTRVRPVAPEDRQSGFGVGFEQRSSVPEEPEADAEVAESERPVTPPVLRVTDPAS